MATLSRYSHCGCGRSRINHGSHLGLAWPPTGAGRRQEGSSGQPIAGLSDHWGMASGSYPFYVRDPPFGTDSQLNIQVGNIMGQLDLFLVPDRGIGPAGGRSGDRQYHPHGTVERTVEFGVMRANGWTQAEHPRPRQGGECTPGPTLRPGRDGTGDRGDRGPELHHRPIRAEAGADCGDRSGKQRGRDRGREPCRSLPRVAGMRASTPMDAIRKRGFFEMGDPSPLSGREEPVVIRVSDVRKAFRSSRRRSKPCAASRSRSCAEPACSSSVHPAPARARCSICWGLLTTRRPGRSSSTAQT